MQPASSTEALLADCRNCQTRYPSSSLYALVDAAQDNGLLSEFVAAGWSSECLFGYDADAQVAQVTPRLVKLPAQLDDPRLTRLAKVMFRQPVATLMASPLGLQSLASHLRQLVDVQLADLDSMFLALWDPAILGTLVGQADDTSLHVQGPVLDAAQRTTLLAPLLAWWYCSREGTAHRVAGGAGGDADPETATEGFVLNAEQVDALVEASVPDHLLHHIAQNQPELLEKLEPAKRYPFVRQQIRRARSYGLAGMGDLTNYVCIALAYGAQFDQLTGVKAVLTQVRSATLTFDQALDHLPEPDLSAAAQTPELLVE
jgi:hypothetical protein